MRWIILAVIIGMAGSPLLAAPTHLWDCGPYPETSPGDTPQEKRDIKLAWARGFSEAIKEADPQGTLFMSGWFLSGADWTPEICREFFSAMTAPYFVADSWFDKHPVYQKCDYFKGVGEWGLGVFHTFGNVSNIHGNLQDLIDRVQGMVADPQKGNLTGFYISPESFHHNFLYYDLVTELAWNPKGVTLDDFLRRYSIRRYGKESAPEMAAAWKLVAETVYGDNDQANPTPTYQDPLSTVTDSPGTASTSEVKKRVSYIPKLRKALAMAEHAANVWPIQRPEETQMPAKKYAIDLLDDCVVSIPENPSWIERHAAEEFVKYVEAMTGTTLEIGSIHGSKAKNIVCIETTNNELKDDAFVVRTLPAGEHNVLAIGGGRGRSTLYAVYDFLEKECGVGFFQDGDHIPKHTTLCFEAIDRTEKPFFARRVAPSPCAYYYTAKYWGPEEWKTELDYMAKRKLNTFYWTIGRGVVMARAWKSLGYEIPEPTEWDLWHEQLQKEVRAYAEALDMDLVNQLWGGDVTKDFAEAHPEIKYLTFRWLDNPLSYYIHPADPAFQKIMRAYVKEWQATYGSVEIWDAAPQGESYSPIGEQSADSLTVKLAWAKEFGNAIRKFAPKAKLFMSSWFMQSIDWSPAVSRQFFETLTTDNFILADVWCEGAPTYEKAGFFGGRGEFLFGVLHTCGVVDHIHGNLLDLITRVKGAVDDERIPHLTGMYICPESFHHNFLYFDLATELAWDPRPVELDDFLRRYCVRRYGRYGSKAMLKAWDIMARTVYGDSTEMNPTPAYQQPLLGQFEDFTRRHTKQIPVVLEGLKASVVEGDRLADNPFYRRDLIDMQRTLYGLFFDFHSMNAYAGFQLKNREMFDHETMMMLYVLDNIADRIAVCPELYLEKEIALASERPKASDPHHTALDSAQQIRQRYTAMAGMDRYPSLLDYARADRVELIRNYYRPRVVAWIDHMRDRMEQNLPISMDFLLQVAYKEITRTFIETGVGQYDGGPLDQPYVRCPGCFTQFYAVVGEGGQVVTFT